MQNDNLKNYLHLHFIVFIWGFTAILGQLISLQAIDLVWYRVLFALILLVIYTLVCKKPLKIKGKLLQNLLFLGGLISIHWITFYEAIKVSNISITLACLSTGAFFAAFLEPLFYKTKIVWYEMVLGLIVICGLSIIFNVETRYKTGIVLGIITAFLSALFSVLNGRFAKKYDATYIAIYELAGGLGFMTLYMIVTQKFSPAFFHISIRDFILLLLLASFCTAYAFAASIKVMKVLSPYTVMLTINLEPIYGIVLAYLIFQDKEKMSTEFYFGAGIILLTVVANGIIKNKLKKIKK
ncbi:EamA family transporter [Flavobacterium branchiophilum]|uniref:EamA domain-containing membrane protein RarD n=1 Tax=Flavobacterium branchiophilum TaxID=55197 RepID=A0A543G6T9_9FLAO|nr:DMT family transporter [Flavobacterium branchiophilum]OXA82323.1 EamA family transporter [Flavobacterium branchiophilum] [Flavobacterium branchiophilum NBRC 15030 = ATCC 35035]TQM41797.1 EamA domain-containing membrane protein RarD [Flavobacterium branchiophilum]GEM56412.1 permease [Flavobacterium branchiophilum NBRC 15030 = ATCC 35035]